MQNPDKYPGKCKEQIKISRKFLAKLGRAPITDKSCQDEELVTLDDNKSSILLNIAKF